MNLLIIEDDPFEALMIHRGLEQAGHTVITANNGKDALRHLNQIAHFQAIVVDWMMPDMDGIAFLEALRQLVDKPPPVLVLTSLDTPQARDRALAAGAADFIAKPVEPNALVSRIRNCITDGNSDRNAPTPTPREKELPVLCLLAGSGDQASVLQVLGAVRTSLPKCATFVIQEGPDWVRQKLREQLTATDMAPRASTYEATIDGGLFVIAPNHQPRTEGSAFSSTVPTVTGDVNATLVTDLARSFGSRMVLVILGRTELQGTGAAARAKVTGAAVLLEASSGTSGRVCEKIRALNQATADLPFSELVDDLKTRLAKLTANQAAS
jgi:DNA-binding response OmpR family regulator